MSNERLKETEDEARARYAAEYADLIATGKSSDERAGDLMSEVEDIWLVFAPKKSADDFTTEVHELFDRDAVDLEELEGEYSAFSTDADAREIGQWPAIETPLLIAYGYAYQARLAASIASTTNDVATDRMAWNYTSRASFWVGVVTGLARMTHGVTGAPTVSDIARGAAHARNAENRQILSDAFKWLDENYESHCNSMDHAAELLTKVVPVAFRTARRYVSKWNKSRPSARSV